MVEDNWTAAAAKNHIYFNGQLIATHDQALGIDVTLVHHPASGRTPIWLVPVHPIKGRMKAKELFGVAVR